MPYEDGSGGCDGCLSFEENGHEHNVLQHTVAILVRKAPYEYLVPIQVSVYCIRRNQTFQEKLYQEKDFPSGYDGKNLDASPKELGISRADLWAFAGLAALDDTLKTSRELCEEVPEEVTCNDWTSSCYSPIPQGKAESLFKTGRSDCIPSPTGTSKQGQHTHTNMNMNETVQDLA